MIRALLIFGISVLSLLRLEAQYISEVLEFVPAPGQFTNTTPWGSPVASSSIIGGIHGSMCLGAFGGFVVFRFDEPVENHPDNPYGVDFTIFGNPMAHWSEPGVVWVMEDNNENGVPDDTWFELAGSDYYFSSTITNYKVTYENPGDTVAHEVSWSDQFGNRGIIKTNTQHTQPYYPLQDSFPMVNVNRYTLSGTFIQGAVDVEHPPILRSIPRAFGYADNHLRGQAPFTAPDNPYTQGTENSGGDAFDIDWAVNQEDEYVELERIHFVKVQNAVQADGSYLGELSTEITGAVDVTPDQSASGLLDLIVVSDLPVEIGAPEYQMEVFVFHKGRLQPGATVQWTTSDENATVDESHIIRVTESGTYILSASLTGQPEIRTEVSATFQLGQATFRKKEATLPGVGLYPNPAGNGIQFTGTGEASLSFFDASGRLVKKIDRYLEEETVDISCFSAGVYMVRVNQNRTDNWIRLLKK